MNRSFLTGLLVFVLSVLVRASPPSDWDLVFADEFSHPTLDDTKWSQCMEFPGIQGPYYHNEYYASYSLEKNISIKSGVLHLATNKEIVSGLEPMGLFEYSQALVASKFTFLYGYVEIRARYPKGKGLWPCLWLMPRGDVWPPEVDIAEYYGGQCKMHHGLAHGVNTDVQWDSSGDCETNFHQWHVIGFYWSKGVCAWFVDGQVCKVIVADYVPSLPMYLVMSNSVGSKLSPTSTPDELTPFPNSLEIDYVRIYQAHPAEPKIVFSFP